MDILPCEFVKAAEIENAAKHMFFAAFQSVEKVQQKLGFFICVW